MCRVSWCGRGAAAAAEALEEESVLEPAEDSGQLVNTEKLW